MAEVTPLFLGSGRFKEIPAADAISARGGIVVGNTLTSAPVTDTSLALSAQPSFWASALRPSLQTEDSLGFISTPAISLVDAPPHYMWTPRFNMGCATVGSTTATAITTAGDKFTGYQRSTMANVATTTNQALGVATSSAVGLFANGMYMRAIWSPSTLPSGHRVAIGFSTTNNVGSSNDTPATSEVGFLLHKKTTDADTVINMLASSGTVLTTVPITIPAMKNTDVYDVEMKVVGGVGTYLIREYFTKATIATGSTTTALQTNKPMSAVCTMSNGTANTTVNSTIITVQSFLAANLS